MASLDDCMVPQPDLERAIKLCDGLRTCVEVGLGDRWCDHDTLVTMSELCHHLMGRAQARTSPYAPWSDGVILTNEQALAKATVLHDLAASRCQPATHPVPAFLSTFAAAAIVFLVATHAAAMAHGYL